MIDYACADCGRTVVKAERAVPVAFSAKCPRCGEITNLERQPGEVLHRTYRCSRCERTQHAERPEDVKTYCIVCGTQSLEIVAERGAARKKRATVRVRQ